VLLGDARGAGCARSALRTRVTKVTRNGDTVTGVEIESVTDAGRETHAIASKILVDATEWGDVVPLTGARYRVELHDDALDPARMCRIILTAGGEQYPHGVPEELTFKQAPPGYTDKIAAGFARTLIDGERSMSGETVDWPPLSATGPCPIARVP